MKIEEVAEILGPNFIPIEIMVQNLSADFSKEELGLFQEVPLTKEALFEKDEYSDALVKDIFGLLPMPERMYRDSNKPFNVAGLINLFREMKMSELEKRIFPFGIGFLSNKEVVSWEFWDRWFAESINLRDHPLQRTQKASWICIRKSVIPESVGKNLPEALACLKADHDFPTLLQAITFMIAYYFRVGGDKKFKAGEDMAWDSRILFSKMAWTKDNFDKDSHLIVGLNTSKGIYIDKAHLLKPWAITGILPIQKLKNP